MEHRDLHSIESVNSAKEKFHQDLGKIEMQEHNPDDPEPSKNNQLVEAHFELDTIEGELRSRKQRKLEFSVSMGKLKETKERRWLIKHGKEGLLDFKDDEIRRLKICFNSLDEDGSGSIGIDELEEPLIGLGFADTREEVKELIDSVDDDGSGMIEFKEFLTIIKNSDGNEKSQKVYEFFKDMTSGQLKKSSEELSFNLLVQKLRREHMRDAIMSTDPHKKAVGERILKNVQRQIAQQKMRKNKMYGLTDFTDKK